MPYDWTRFTRRIHIQSSPEHLYGMWTIPANLEYWFLRSATFLTSSGDSRLPNDPIEAGDTYTWMWHGYPDSSAEKGTVLEAEAQNFKFTFGGPKENPMIVTVTFPVEDGKTIVQLVQENIPTDETSVTNYHMGCMEGWTFYLINLKSLVEGGIDLRERSELLKGMINK